jgi:enoyl-CoA hydratase/carnithine racemase
MENLEVSRQGAVLSIRFDRAEKKNALTESMYLGLKKAIGTGEADPAVRSILMHGGTCFSAGNDLRDFIEHPPRDAQSAVFQFLEALRACSKPVVAAVAGVAVGIGTTMLLHCDLVYAAEGTRFGLPFVGLGLCPEGGASFILPRLAGHARAAKWLLLGESFDAAEAARCGLVTRVVPAETVLEVATAAAQRLAEQPARALRATRLLMRAGGADALGQALREEARVLGGLVDSPEAQEAFRAFLEKRKPDFRPFD